MENNENHNIIDHAAYQPLEISGHSGTLAMQR
jgi:hypothetical protein